MANAAVDFDAAAATRKPRAGYSEKNAKDGGVVPCPGLPGRATERVVSTAAADLSASLLPRDGIGAATIGKMNWTEGIQAGYKSSENRVVANR